MSSGVSRTSETTILGQILATRAKRWVIYASNLFFFSK